LWYAYWPVLEVAINDALVVKGCYLGDSPT